MTEIAGAIMIGLPLAVCVGGPVWFEVAKVNALKAIGLAALEAEKQVAIAKAQAGGGAPGGAGEGVERE